MSCITVMGSYINLTTMSTTCDYRSNRSVKLVHKIFPLALQILFVTRDLATVLTEMLVQFITAVDVTVIMQWRLCSQDSAFLQGRDAEFFFLRCLRVAFGCHSKCFTPHAFAVAIHHDGVIMHWAISCAQILSAKLGDDDSLVVLLWALAWQTVHWPMSDRSIRSVMHHRGLRLPSLRIMHWFFFRVVVH